MKRNIRHLFLKQMTSLRREGRKVTSHHACRIANMIVKRLKERMGADAVPQHQRWGEWSPKWRSLQLILARAKWRPRAPTNSRKYSAEEDRATMDLYLLKLRCRLQMPPVVPPLTTPRLPARCGFITRRIAGFQAIR